MTGLGGRLVRIGRPIAGWYASPAGAASAIALVIALGLSAAGLAGAAVWVLAAWLAVLLPYKLTRERAERSQQNAALARRLGRVEAELAMTPTVTELVEWQETIERRSARVRARVESLGQLAESLRQQRESTQALHDQHAALRASVDARLRAIEQQQTDADE